MRPTRELLVLQQLFIINTGQIRSVPARPSLHELVDTVYPVVLVQSLRGYRYAINSTVSSEIIDMGKQGGVLRLNYKVKSVPGHYLKRNFLHL